MRFIDGTELRLTNKIKLCVSVFNQKNQLEETHWLHLGGGGTGILQVGSRADTDTNSAVKGKNITKSQSKFCFRSLVQEKKKNYFLVLVEESIIKIQEKHDPLFLS